MDGDATAQHNVAPIWGAAAFAAALRSRLWSRSLVEEGKEDEPKANWSQLPDPPAWNILVLGPAGAGKSSLLFTWWRSIRESPSAEEQQSVLSDLSLGWNVDDAKRRETTNKVVGDESDRQGLRSRHGTTGLRVLELLPSRGENGAGLVVHDTKGQQFFDGAEKRDAGRYLYRR